jgi:hypothetical protein
LRSFYELLLRLVPSLLSKQLPKSQRELSLQGRVSKRVSLSEEFARNTFRVAHGTPPRLSEAARRPRFLDLGGFNLPVLES